MSPELFIIALLILSCNMERICGLTAPRFYPVLRLQSVFSLSALVPSRFFSNHAGRWGGFGDAKL